MTGVDQRACGFPAYEMFIVEIEKRVPSSSQFPEVWSQLQ